MKISFFLLTFAACVSSLAFAQTKAPPHFDLEMSSLEYQHEWNKQNFFKQFLPSSDSFTQDSLRVSRATDPVQRAIDLGNRNLEWLKIINDKRTKIKLPPLSFWSPSTIGASPIDKPRVYSPKIVEEMTQEALYKVSPAFKNVIDSAAPLPEYPPMPEADYLNGSREIDRVYQLAIRWNLLSPWKDHYTKRKQYDVRGVYYLNQEKDLEGKLKDFSNLSRSDIKRFRKYLVILCQNTQGTITDTCERDLDNEINQNKVYEFYQQYLPAGQAMWDDFFALENPRSDVSWSNKDSSTMSVPFLDPQDKEVENFLRDNIHDEWHFGPWKLNLNFSNSARIYVRFAPDENPHVNSLGGDQITMNQNVPLTEYDAQWTIRHEFGHTLGLKDCYVEFYDPKEGVMIAYQLDITNLMCSRRGHLQQIHYDTLKKNYFTP